MHPAYEIPQFITSRSDASTIDADLVAIPVFQGAREQFEWLNQSTNRELSAAFDRAEFSGKSCEVWTGQGSGWRSSRVLAVGVGPQSELGAERARRVGTCVGLTARGQKRARIAVVLGDAWTDQDVEAVVEGVTVANYDNGHYKSKHEVRFFVASVEIAGGKSVSGTVERGQRLGEAINAARLLINEPGNRLTPREFVARGQALVSVPGVTTE